MSSTKISPITIGLVVVLGLALALLPNYTSGYYLQLSIVVLTMIALAESWGFFSGYTGYISLGVAAFFGAGKEIYAYFAPTMPFVAVILFAGAIAAVVALGLGPIVLRIRGTYFVILTYVLAAIVQALVTNYESAYFHTVGKIAPVQSSATVYYIMVVVAVATIFLSCRIKNSRTGLGLFAIRNDEDVAEASGVNTVWLKIAFFALSSFIAGVAGATSTAVSGYVNPASAFNPVISFQILIMASLGGMKSVRGPIVGALVLTLFSQFLLAAYPLINALILGVVLIGIVLLLPDGIVGAYEARVHRVRAQPKSG